jgi:uncharacterized protein YraI
MMIAKRLAAAAAVLGLSAGVAAASPAVTETDLNMRTGPGTEYGVVTVIPGGATVDVGGCGGGWCDVAWNGFDGFASASYLDSLGVVTVAPPAVYAGPSVVVRDRSYVRPGRVINRTVRGIRRAIRRDARQDRREWRREMRQDRREARRDRRRDARRDVRRDRRVERRQVRQNNRAQMRRENRQERRAARGGGGRRM